MKFKFLLIMLLVIGCANYNELKQVRTEGARKSYKGKEVELNAILINKGIKICPQDGGTLSIRSAYYSLYRSKRNDTLYFEKNEDCYEAPLNLAKNRTYKINLLVDTDQVSEKEVNFEVGW